jgi:predicted TIM-barrel fold metal-dependent hydrolase
MRQRRFGSCDLILAALAAALTLGGGEAVGAATSTASRPGRHLFNDSHVHLTNYVQEGISARELLELMGNQVGRAALFGIPLQQQWSHRVSGDDAPIYYLDTDSPLYYYSFTDAFIAMQYRSLSKSEQARLDPMITGFNPTDMYAADHIRRVLQTFPGVFVGIGEFTIHKEFVSPKVAGDAASLADPALDRIFDFAGEVGLLTLIHNDIAKPFPKAATTDYLPELKALFKRHPGTTIIWAHIGLGRVIHPIKDQVAAVEEILHDPAFDHVYFDISWDEVNKYAVASDAAIERVADALNQYPDRFLFGTDTVAPRDGKAYFGVYHLWDPVIARLTPEAREKVFKGNYERLFDAGRAKVRAWEKAHAK